jgi:hypothetical protein
MNANRILVFTLMIGLTGLAACGGNPVAENPQASATKPPQQEQQPSAPVAPAEQFVVGEVQEVDPVAMTLVLKDTKGQEQTFNFSATTSITGGADAKSLPAQEGRPATIRYVEQGGGKSATQIHIEMGS